MYGDPRPGVKPPAAAIAHNMLKQRIRQLAVAGRLRVSENRAADLVPRLGVRHRPDAIGDARGPPGSWFVGDGT